MRVSVPVWNLWWNLYKTGSSDYQRHWDAAQRGYGPSIDRMEALAAQVALARLKGLV